MLWKYDLKPYNGKIILSNENNLKSTKIKVAYDGGDIQLEEFPREIRRILIHLRISTSRYGRPKKWNF